MLALPPLQLVFRPVTIITLFLRVALNSATWEAEAMPITFLAFSSVKAIAKQVSWARYELKLTF